MACYVGFCGFTIVSRLRYITNPNAIGIFLFIALTQRRIS